MVGILVVVSGVDVVVDVEVVIMMFLVGRYVIEVYCMELFVVV